ncbi:hypothetical protein Tco_0630052, partial [Tanacetum coccineum]
CGARMLKKLQESIPNRSSWMLYMMVDVARRSRLGAWLRACWTSGSISDFVSDDLRRKLQAGTSAYEAKKQKELVITEFKELEFLTIDPDTLPKPKANIIRKKQEKIIAKYNQE